MQQFMFEQAWARTISDSDKEMIEETFLRLDHHAKRGVQTTYVRHAINHKGQLLYTVLLHNYMHEPCVIKNQEIELADGNGNSITGNFTLPLIISAHTSMPWTFIFPQHCKQMNMKQAKLMLS